MKQGVRDARKERAQAVAQLATASAQRAIVQSNMSTLAGSAARLNSRKKRLLSELAELQEEAARKLAKRVAAKGRMRGVASVTEEEVSIS